MVNHFSIKYKHKRIYINHNFQRIINIYTYLQVETFRNIIILILQKENIQKYMTLFHL